MSKSAYDYVMRVDGKFDIIEEKPIPRIERITIGEARDEQTAMNMVKALNKAEHLPAPADEGVVKPSPFCGSQDYYEYRDNERARKAIRNFVQRNNVTEYPGKTGLNAIQKAWDDMVMKIRYNARAPDPDVCDLQRQLRETSELLEQTHETVRRHHGTIVKQDKLIDEMRRLLGVTK